jgi:hypothetical protein
MKSPDGDAVRTGPTLISRVDHLYARVEDPRALFVTLTERLGLPRSYGFCRVPGFEGGAVSLGNVVFLEVLRYAPDRNLPPPSNPGLDGLALESPLPIREAASELSRRGLPHAPVIPFAGDPVSFRFGAPLQRAGLRDREGPLWSTVVLGGFLGDRQRERQFRFIPSGGGSRLALLLGRLQGKLLSSPRFADRVMARSITSQPTVWVQQFDAADMAMANAAAAEELAACDGGPLGLRRVAEVVLGARDLRTERERWQRLLAPAAPAADGAWHLGDGPALRLVHCEADRIKSVVCEVASLDRATEFLAEENLLGSTDGRQARLLTSELQGLDIGLTERATEAAGGLSRGGRESA